MSIDDEKTPVEPAIRRSSAQHRLAMEDCPQCKRDGYSMTCSLCGGGRKVAADTAIRWTVEHGSDPPSKGEP